MPFDRPSPPSEPDKPQESRPEPRSDYSHLPSNSDLRLPYLSRAAERQRIAAVGDVDLDERKSAVETPAPTDQDEESEKGEQKSSRDLQREAVEKERVENPRRLLGRPSEPGTPENDQPARLEDLRSSHREQLAELDDERTAEVSDRNESAWEKEPREGDRDDRPESAPTELGGPRSKYDASFTEEQRQERIAELMPNAQRAMGAENWANSFRAGTVYEDFKREDVKAKYPDGVPFSYEGCPQFERFALAVAYFPKGSAATRCTIPRRPTHRPDTTAVRRRRFGTIMRMGRRCTCSTGHSTTT